MRRMMALPIALAVGFVSGCSGPRTAAHPGPPSAARTTAPTTTSPPPTPPDTGSASPTPGSAVASVPVAARQHSEAGAEAFVRFYIEQLNVAWTTPRAGLLRALSDPGCKSCAAFEATASRLAAAGQHYAVSPVTVASVTAYGGAPAQEQLLRTIGAQNRADVVDHAGRTVSTDPLEPMKWDVLLGWEGATWRVLDLG